MNKIYTSSDVVQMAIQAKGKGVELYMALARNSENYHVSNLFAELAKDEQKHKLQLEKWFDSLRSDEREEAYPGEKALYLKALVDENVFNCEGACKRALNQTISEEDALQAGITFEKDFMLFLHELKQNTATESAATVDKLIEEEVSHLGKMFRLREKIKK